MWKKLIPCPKIWASCSVSIPKRCFACRRPRRCSNLLTTASFIEKLPQALALSSGSTNCSKAAKTYSIRLVLAMLWRMWASARQCRPRTETYGSKEPIASLRSCSRHFRFIPDIGHVVAALSDATGQQRRSRDLMARVWPFASRNCQPRNPRRLP
jgi:hypothetical protein